MPDGIGHAPSATSLRWRGIMLRSWFFTETTIMNMCGLLVLVLCAVALGCDRSAAVGADKSAGGEKPKTPATQATTSPVGKVEKSEAEWKKILTPEEYEVLRQKGTELAFRGKYDEHFEP